VATLSGLREAWVFGIAAQQNLTPRAGSLWSPALSVASRQGGLSRFDVLILR